MFNGIVLAVVFSKGDLGDVGRHAVAAALEMPGWLVSSIRVFSPHIQSMDQNNWNCGCPGHTLSQEDKFRLQLIEMDCSVDDIIPHLVGVDAVVSCLGNRQPLNEDRIAKYGTERLVQGILAHGIGRFVMISSVGIAEDWPPLTWSSDGEQLAGIFQRLCRKQYDDLAAAEKAVLLAAQLKPSLNFLIVRSVLTPEYCEPVGTWHVQIEKRSPNHPSSKIAKMDCARFMIREAVVPSYSRQAVLIGGCP